MKRILLTVTIVAGLCLGLLACGDSHSAKKDSAKPLLVPTFSDVSKKIGLVTEENWKYGGPSVSDINNDGYYDFLLTNHDSTPVRLYLSKGDGSYLKQADIFGKADLHGISSGDYDLDGDNDVLLSLGGGNGLSPQPQRLLRNDNGKFVDITIEAGISEMGARGRAVRWVDLDNDGDLDFLQINAEKMVNEQAPRNIIFSNNGDGTFTYVSSPSIEEIDAERLLITDFNNDHVPDVFAFNSYSNAVLLQGNGDFSFTDVSAQVFPKDMPDVPSVIAVAQADIDNDGDLDYYLARGKLYYTIANNSVSFDKARGRLDLRDQGSKSHDGITLFAEEDVALSDFYHFPRAKNMLAMPAFIGKNKTPIGTPTTYTPITQEQGAGFPDEISETGWYLGYLGEGKWRLEWMLADEKLAWDVRASVLGLSGYKTDWEPQDLSVPDLLFRNDNGKFTNISNVLPKEVMTNNWGVVPGDFNNDGYNDFFVYRFGELRQRVVDVLLLNKGDGTFQTELKHGATASIGEDSHGDMGTAFDFNLDGRIDILSGDDDNGKWHMYRNDIETSNKTAYLLARVGYSTTGVDAYGAKVTIKSASGRQFKLIGSTSANHSQSLLNIAHFGLGTDEKIKSITVRWRDGSQQMLSNVAVNQLVELGRNN